MVVEQAKDMFWKDCPLVHSDPDIVHGEPVIKGTRLPAFAIADNVEAFIELRGMSEDEAIEATLRSFPGVPGGSEGIRAVLAYQKAHEPQLIP